MQVSKEYLTKDGKYLAEGIRETAIELDKRKRETVNAIRHLKIY